MILRNFCGNDVNLIPPLWKRNQPYLVMSRELFLRKIVLEDNFNPLGFFVAEENGNALGFVYAVYRVMPYCRELQPEQDAGWIAGFSVFDKTRFMEIGTALLNAAETYLSKLGRRTVSTAFLPNYFAQGIAADVCPEYVELFNGAGYASSESCALSLDLSGYIEDPSLMLKREQLATEGISVGALRPEQIYSLFYQSSLYSGHSWSVEIRSRLESYDYGRIRIASKGEKILGVAPFGDPGSDMGRFGPFVVDASVRGRGIGTVLFADCLAEMKRRNIPRAWMQWVHEGGTAFRLYSRFGFKKEHTFLTFQKVL